MVTKLINEYAKNYPREYPGGVEYYSMAFIGVKRSTDSIEIIKDLVYKVSQSTNYNEASETIRKVYFNELLLDKHKEYYNINDIRFWDCEVWKYPDGSIIQLE